MTVSRAPALPVADDEGDLVCAARAGDRDAFRVLFRRHVDRVRSQLTRFVGAAPERDDLVQEVFLRLHQGLASYRGECALSTFLHRLTVNAALDHLRSAKRRRATLVPDTALESLIPEGVSESERAQARDELRALFRMLERLTDKKRVAFQLVAIEGLSLLEAAQVVGANADAVKQRVLAARRELETMIAAEQLGEGAA